MKSLKSIFIIGKIGVEMANLSWSIMQLIDCCLYLFLGYSLFGEKIKGNKKNIYGLTMLVGYCRLKKREGLQ